MDFSENLTKFQEQIQNLKCLKNYEVRSDPAFLLRFLKTAKNDLNKAVARYEAYYLYLLDLPFIAEILTGEVHEFGWIIKRIEEIENKVKRQGYHHMIEF